MTTLPLLPPPCAELSQHVATVGAQAAYPNPEGSHEARVSELEGANAEAQAVTVALTGELRELEQQREKLKERFAELHHRSEDVDRMVTEAEPQTRQVGSPLGCCWCAARPGAHPAGPLHALAGTT